MNIILSFFWQDLSTSLNACFPLFALPEMSQHKEHDQHTHVKGNSPVVSNEIPRRINSFPNASD